MSDMTPSVIVVGATGKQGGAVVSALGSLPDPRPKILALTRNPSSPAARALLGAVPQGTSLELILGDPADPQPIFASQPRGSVSGVFLLTVPTGDEEAQAIPLIDAAAAHGVRHLVFSSVERGGDARSWENPTCVRHFLQKHNVELYLRRRAAREGERFTWTILRPVAFMDNLNPGMFCSVFTAMWAAALGKRTKLQLVAVRDIGRFAAKVLAEPERWAGKAVGLAGDELTLDEAKEKFGRVTGGDLPQSWYLVGMAMLWYLGDIREMFRWFEEEGYGVDITALTEEDRSVQDFETWLRESSKWMSG